MRRALSIGLPLATFAAIAAAWEILAVDGGFPPKPCRSRRHRRYLLSPCRQRHPVGSDRGDTLSPGCRLSLRRGDWRCRGHCHGRRQWIEDTLLPIVTFFYPIPGLAYAPLFVLWFGLGDFPTILLIGISSCFTVIINTWKGVKRLNQFALRSAQVMGAQDREMFRRVVVPGALPYILVGLRLGLAQASQHC